MTRDLCRFRQAHVLSVRHGSIFLNVPKPRDLIRCELLRGVNGRGREPKWHSTSDTSYSVTKLQNKTCILIMFVSSVTLRGRTISTTPSTLRAHAFFSEWLRMYIINAPRNRITTLWNTNYSPKNLLLNLKNKFTWSHITAEDFFSKTTSSRYCRFILLIAPIYNN